jgi:hypothetical protein
MNVEAGPFLFGRPEDYARGKVGRFPDEGGPVILAVDVPDDIVQRAANDWFTSVRAWSSSISVPAWRN